MAPLDSDYIRPASPSSSAFLWREDTTGKAEEVDHTDQEREDDDEDFTIQKMLRTNLSDEVYLVKKEIQES